MVAKNYGVVYTPDRLAEFAAELLYRVAAETNTEIKSILDPACGECALLCAVKKYFDGKVKYWGIDVDKEAILNIKDSFEIFCNDSILPRNVKKQSAQYWKSKMPVISAIIANPPWSSEKIYARDELHIFTIISQQTVILDIETNCCPILLSLPHRIIHILFGSNMTARI